MSTVVKDENADNDDEIMQSTPPVDAPSTTMSPFLAKISTDEDREWKLKHIKST